MEKKETLAQTERWIEKMYKLIIKTLVQKDKHFSKLSQSEQNAKMNILNIAYSMAKAFHRGQTRIDGTRYFEHIKSVTYILITEFPTITFNQVAAAYLHDILEDTDIKDATIENIFGREITEIVQAVTKKPDEYYLRPDERHIYHGLGKEEKKEYLKQKKPAIKARRTEHWVKERWHCWNHHRQVKQANSQVARLCKNFPCAKKDSYSTCKWASYNEKFLSV